MWKPVAQFVVDWRVGQRYGIVLARCPEAPAIKYDQDERR
jgi:hypothetical protein